MVWIFSPCGQAQNQAGMRLEDLEQMALSGNPTMAQAQANVRLAAGRASQSAFYPNPTIGYYGDEIRGGYYGGGKQGGFVSQKIIIGGKIGAARRAAQLLVGEAETNGEAQRLRILNNVRALFYEVLVDQRLVDVRENLSKLSADATQTSHQLANIGQADRPDVLQAELEQQQTNIALRAAQQNLKASWRALTAVVGKPDLPQTRLEGDPEAVPELNYDEWLATTLRDSPEVKVAQQNVGRAEALLAQAKKAPIPDLELYGSLSQNNEPLTGNSPRITGLNGGVQIGVQCRSSTVIRVISPPRKRRSKSHNKISPGRSFKLPAALATCFEITNRRWRPSANIRLRCCRARKRRTDFTKRTMGIWRRHIRWH